MFDNTAAREGKSFLCGNVSACPSSPLLGRSSNPPSAIAPARRCARPRASVVVVVAVRAMYLLAITRRVDVVDVVIARVAATRETFAVVIIVLVVRYPRLRRARRVETSWARVRPGRARFSP
jgi:hypothetical protein